MPAKIEHTPGPWYVDELGHVCGGPRDEPIALLGNSWPGNKANAHLISAAPEMAEALKILVTEIQGSCNQWRLTEFAITAEAALQKAGME